MAATGARAGPNTRTRRPAASRAARVPEGLDEAFAALAAVYRAGAWVEIARGQPLFRGEIAQLDDRHRKTLLGRGEATRALLLGPRCEAARDRIEAVISPRFYDARVSEAAVLHLSERRRLGAPFKAVGAGLPQAIAGALRGVDTLILPAQPFAGRVALGLCLADAGVKQIEILEVDPKARQDGRDLLAGSFWTEMHLGRLEHGSFEKALLLALQVRSLRGTPLSEHKQSYYLACAARHLAKDGADLTEIAARLGLAERVVASWTGQIPGSENRTTRPATDRQKAGVARRLARLPALSRALPNGWEDDLEAASRGIEACDTLLSRFGTRLDALNRERDGRLRLGAGQSLADAAVAAGIDVEEMRVLLDSDFTVRLERLAEQLGEVLGDPVPVRELFALEDGV